MTLISSTPSPVNDLLDNGDFTLEDLLVEDEIIQEMKSKNERLIELYETIILNNSVGNVFFFLTVLRKRMC